MVIVNSTHHGGMLLSYVNVLIFICENKIHFLWLYILFIEDDFGKFVWITSLLYVCKHVYVRELNFESFFV